MSRAGPPRAIATIQKGALSTMDETLGADGRAPQQPTDAPETLGRGQPNRNQVAGDCADTMASTSVEGISRGCAASTAVPDVSRLRILAHAVVDAVHYGEPTGLLDREIQREVFGPPNTGLNDTAVGRADRTKGNPRHDTVEAGPGPATSAKPRHEVTTGSTHAADTGRAQPTATDELLPAGGGDAIERARCAVEQVTLARAQHQATRRRSGDHVRAQIADRGVYDLELWDSGGVIDQPFSGL